jgi:hypothetical protein
MVASLTMRENRKAATKAKKVQLQEELGLYPWRIREDFGRLTKLICWTQRSLIKLLGLEINYSRRRNYASAHYDTKNNKIILSVGKDKAHAYASLIWNMSWIDSRANHKDVFMTAASSFLVQPIPEGGFGNVVAAFEEYTKDMQESEVTNAKVHRRTRKPQPKTKLGSAISTREKKAVW